MPDRRRPHGDNFFLARRNMTFFPPAMKHVKTLGRPRFHPTDMQRRLVRLLASEAVPQFEISQILGIDGKR